MLNPLLGEFIRHRIRSRARLDGRIEQDDLVIDWAKRRKLIWKFVAQNVVEFVFKRFSGRNSFGFRQIWERWIVDNLDERIARFFRDSDRFIVSRSN